MGATQNENIRDCVLRAKHSQRPIVFSLLLNEQNQILCFI